MKMLMLFLFLCCFHQISSLRTISDEDFAQFPLLHEYDRFSECVERPGGVYCTAHADLLAGRDTHLYEMMRNYSESAIRHFNYTKIIRGYCMTGRCQQYYNQYEPVEGAVSECLNSTLAREHGLRGLITSITCYSHDRRTQSFDVYDALAIGVFLLLGALALAASVYDFFGTKKDPKGYLLCFSLPANWARLKAPWPEAPSTSRLIGINGIRTITSILVILLHSNLPQTLLMENPQYVERAFEATYSQFLFHIHLVMQTFFFLSGLFLAYTHQVASEKNPSSNMPLHKAVFLRWLRLSPVYFVMLMFAATLGRFASYGPVWKELLGEEVADCRRYWPGMVMYLTNYQDYNNCGLQHWSTACDMHLHIMGLSVLLLAPSVRARNIALSILFIIGFCLPGLETYFRDLDGPFLAVGEVIHSTACLNQSPTYTHLYKRTHTNIPCFIIGMVLGIKLHEWLKKPIDANKYKNYSYLYWLLFPAILGLIFVTSFLARAEGGKGSMTVRLLYALLQKPAWGVVLALLVLGLVFKVEKVPLYRGVLEWRGWVPLMRLTYCTYNVHIPILRWLGASSSLTRGSDLQAMNNFMGATGLSFVFAVAVWLLVEAPFNNLVRKLFPEKKSVLDRGCDKTE